MRKLSLSEWASLGELIATFAVVVSLVFVVLGIRQNTAAVQGGTENLLFELHADLANQFIEDPSMAAIAVKLRSGEGQLTPVESVRWEKYHLNMLDIWALAHTRNERGLLGQDQWETWDRYFVELFSEGAERLSFERWDQLQYGFDSDFWAHVRQKLFR